MASPETAPLACTLDLGEMAPRLARLQRLAATGLLSHVQQGNALHLAYRPEAAAEVRAIVALERQCCAFLHFEVDEAPAGVALTITAPDGLGEAAQWLFAQFLPAAAAAPAQRSCCGGCT